MTRTHACLLLSLAVAACGRTHAADDAALAIDAGAPPGDASTRPDVGTCAEGIAWIDEEPIVRARFGDVPPAMAADGDGFLVVSSVFIPDGCEGPCVHVERFASRGDDSALVEVPLWREERSEPFRVFAGTDLEGRARYAIAWSDELRWGEGPSWASEAGRVRFDGTLGAVAFERSGVLVETHDTFATADRRADSIGARVGLHGPGDTPEQVLEELDPTAGFEFWSPALAVGPGGPWLAVLQDVDFPPAVQVAGPSGGGWVGSSCGVTTYDLLAESASDVVIAADCGDRVNVQRRRIGSREWDAMDVEGRDPSSPIGSRIASDGEHLALVHRGLDGAAYVTVLSSTLDVLATARVPGSDALPSPGSMEIEATRDGTFAVLVTDTSRETYERMQLTRFALCER